jgi:hypothetical protein
MPQDRGAMLVVTTLCNTASSVDSITLDGNIGNKRSIIDRPRRPNR